MVVLDLRLTCSAAGIVKTSGIQIQVLAHCMQHQTTIAVGQLCNVHGGRPFDEEGHQFLLQTLQLARRKAVAAQKRAQVAVDAHEALVRRLHKFPARGRRRLRHVRVVDVANVLKLVDISIVVHISIGLEHISQLHFATMQSMSCLIAMACQYSDV